jgi:hypothetical protein
MRSLTPAGPYRTAMISELWRHGGRRKRDDPRAARPRPPGLILHCRQRAPGDGFDVPARWSTSFKRESRLAECWRDLHTVGQTFTLAPECYPTAHASISASTPAHACADSQATEFAGTRRLRIAVRCCSSRDELFRVDQAQIVEQRFLAQVPGAQSDIAVRANVSEFGIVDAERGP